MKKKLSLLIFLVIIVPIVAYLVFYNARAFRPIHQNKNTSSTANSSLNQNTSNEEPADTNTPGSIITTSEVTLKGRVFIKGYGSASESYGLLSETGYEVSFGKYDSMKEQFRPYINDTLEVTFERICRSSDPNCCLTLFPYCGTVKSWQVP